MTNDELSATYDTSDQWIRERTGIVQRRRAAPGQSTGDLAVEAARVALASAERSSGPAPVDLVVLATSTPDRPCPATAPSVAHRLGLGPVPAFDVDAVCSGFVYGLAVADGMIAAGTARRVLLVGADTFSTILNPADRTTAAIFGDGAGAVVLRAGERGEPGALQGLDLGSDGGQADLITVVAGGSRVPDRATAPEADRFFAMQGQAVYRNAVARMAQTARAALAKAGWGVHDVNRFIAHQANARLLAAAGAELGIEAERAYRNISEVGNTVAASIPLALADAATDGALLPGDRVLLAAFGGGTTWGAAALTWPELAAFPRPERTASP
ncbi:3-oxoacyl-[acyl-carrier-protein] synthase III (EC 2.3.1.41) [Actinosynnema pretiosum]|nr:3-oxoacyl-[acyl-carrier-protein] synthase III (EC 2.3.1.41) [Actinosynnema pretiosum]